MAPSPVQVDAEAVERSLARIDRRMSAIAEMRLVPPVELPPAQAALFEKRAAIGRAATRTFFMTGAFLELSEADRAHPGVQERVRRMQPEMDRAVCGMADLLESLTPEERRLVQEQLRKTSDAGARVAELFTENAAEDGIGFKRRLDVRMAFDRLARSMRAQNPSLIIDPCVRKVRKLQASLVRDDERMRSLAATMGENAFWDYQQRQASYANAWDLAYASRERDDVGRIDDAYPPPPPPAQEPEDPTRSPSNGLRAGGYIMGFGVVSELIALIAYAAAEGNGVSLVLGVTVGPILLAIGLLVVIVSGIWYLAAKP